MPVVHFIWVGPPPDPKTDSITIPGHDIGGPLSLAAHTDPTINPIKFWCQSEHIEHYERAFATVADKITVKSIEEELSEPDHQCINISSRSSINRKELRDKLFDRVLKSEGRGKVRDRVTVKNAFSFHLLFKYGGYYFDTNLYVIDSSKLTLPDFKEFRLPYMGDLETGKQRRFYDIWLMYAPKELHRMNITYCKFLVDWYRLEQRFTEYTRDYNSTIGVIAISAIVLSDSDIPNRKGLEEFEAILTSNNYTAIIDELGLVKYYYNTHKFDADGSQILIAVELKDIFQINLMLDEGIDINCGYKRAINLELADTKGHIFGETALDYAVLMGNTEMVELLLSRGADPHHEHVQIINYRVKGAEVRTTYSTLSYAQALAEKYPASPIELCCQLIESHVKNMDCKSESDSSSVVSVERKEGDKSHRKKPYLK